MDSFPDLPEFWKGVKEFRAHEKRDAMYKVATRLLESDWGKHVEVAEGLGVLLLTWNQALYRYGGFDFDKLQKVLIENHNDLTVLRGRNILTWNEQQDNLKVSELFEDFMEALISEGKDGKNRRSPVAVAKALHLLAPNFFPLWDEAIAKGYVCYWTNSDKAAEKYLCFSKKIKSFCEHLSKNKVKDDSNIMTLLKLIDEYNYSKYTQGWV